MGGLGGGHAPPRDVGSSVGRSRPRPRSAARKARRRRWRRRPPGAPSSRRPASQLEEVTVDSENAARWRAAGAGRGDARLVRPVAVPGRCPSKRERKRAGTESPVRVDVGFTGTRASRCWGLRLSPLACACFAVPLRLRALG